TLFRSEGILAVNSVIVPLMIMFTIIAAVASLQAAPSSVWAASVSELPEWRLLLSPFLYTSLNLSLAQAVLVPIGSAVGDRNVLRAGGIVGGCGMALLLLIGHLSLSVHMPDIMQLEIPMAYIIHPLGQVIQFLFLLIIFSEIFTTLIADAFGLTGHIRQYVRWKQPAILLLILGSSYAISQIGFSRLVSLLYPLFGVVSISWLVLLIHRKTKPDQ